MIIWKEFKFDSAHALSSLPDGHKCGNMHGHTFTLRVYVKGRHDGRKPWVMDFGDIKKVVGPIVDSLDHSLLNETTGLDDPTCENLCLWFWDKLRGRIPGLHKVYISESPSSGCEYEGP